MDAIFFDGSFNASSIKAWVKKKLRNKPLESIYLKNLQDFYNALQNEEKYFSLYFGKHNSDLFKIYDKLAKTK